MRVAVVHNLAPGGAHRRLSEQVSLLRSEVIEVCLATAAPVTEAPVVVALRPGARRSARWLRPPLRYLDLAQLLRAWREAAQRVQATGAEVVYANPCRYLQAPAALLWTQAPALYFCDEPRRVDHDPVASRSRSAATTPLYAPLYAVERRSDRRAVARARALATNSAFSAGEIRRAYGRDAAVVPMGIAEAFRVDSRAPTGDHVLSVGSLIPSKGHDIVLAAAARATVRRRVVVVAPAGDPAEAARLRALAANLGVELDLRTAIADSELARLYASAHATVYMAVREPFGLVSLEAQAAGSPVIVADDGGLPETLAPGLQRWAVPREAAAVARCLDALSDSATRAGVAEQARARVQAASWTHSAQAIDAMLAALCA